MSRFFTSVRVLCNRFVVAVALIFGIFVGNSFGAIYSYDLRGGDLPDGQTSIETESTEGYITVANPVKTGYTFTGWCADSYFDDNDTPNNFDDDTCSDDLEAPNWLIPVEIANGAQNETYHAFWEEIAYPINYNLSNGETNHSDNPSTFVDANLPITLQKPTHTDYAFMGWCADDPQSHSMVLCTMGNTVKQIKVCSDDATSFCSDQDVTIGNKTNGVTLYPTWVADEELYCDAGTRAYFAVYRQTGNLTDRYCTWCEAGGYCPDSKTYKLSEATEEIHYNWSTSEYAVEYIVGNRVMCSDGQYNPYGGYGDVSACRYCPYGSHSSDDRATCICEDSDAAFFNSGSWNAACVSSVTCDAGTYIRAIEEDGRKSVWCDGCSTGYYCPENVSASISAVLSNTDDCEISGDNRYCNYGRSKCGEGTYSDNTWLKSCKVCTNGTVYNWSGGMEVSSGGRYCKCDNGYYLDSTNGGCVLSNQISCPAGKYARVYDIDSTNPYFYCDNNCRPGYACDGGTYGISTATSLFDYENVVGAKYCGDDPTDPEHAYTNGYGMSECSYCENGLIANSEHTNCVCPDGQLYNMDTQTCSEHITCDSDQFAFMDTDDYNNKRYRCWQRYNCRDGYYCPETNPNDPNGWSWSDVVDNPRNGEHYIGAIRCPNDGVSPYGSTDVSACSVCDASEHKVFSLHHMSSCICEIGYILNKDTGECVDDSAVSCGVGNAIQVGETLYDIGDGLSDNHCKDSERNEELCSKYERYGGEGYRYLDYKCVPCKIGHKCDGGTYDMVDTSNMTYLDNPYCLTCSYYPHSSSMLGMVKCGGTVQINDETVYEYQNETGQSSCKTCPVEATGSTLYGESCSCPEVGGMAQMFDASNNQCSTASITVSAGHSAVFKLTNGVITSIEERDGCSDYNNYGGYCEGGPFTFADAQNNCYDNGANRQDCYAGKQRCPAGSVTNLYRATSESDCVTCDGGETNDAQTACLCGAGTANQDGVCKSSFNIDRGVYINLRKDYNGNISYNYRGRCGNGYYCPGGTYNVSQCDFDGYDECILGRSSCGIGLSSPYEATSVSQCRACPTEHAGSIEMHDDMTVGCSCEDGYWFDDSAWKCVRRCPDVTTGQVIFGSGGVLYGMGSMYDENAQSCVALWLVIDDFQSLQSAIEQCVIARLPQNPTQKAIAEATEYCQETAMYNPDALLQAGTSVMLCKQSTEAEGDDKDQEAEYLGGCTRAAKVCSASDYADFVSVAFGDSESIVPYMRTLLGSEGMVYSDSRTISSPVEVPDLPMPYTNTNVPAWIDGSRCPVVQESFTACAPIDLTNTVAQQGQYFTSDAQAFIDFNNDGLDQSDCVASYWYGPIWAGLLGAYAEYLPATMVAQANEQSALGIYKNNTPLNMFGLGSVVFCRYDDREKLDDDTDNPAYGTYTKDCSAPISVCSQQDLMRNEMEALMSMFGTTQGAMSIASLMPGSGINASDSNWRKNLFPASTESDTDLASRANNFTFADNTCHDGACDVGYEYTVSQAGFACSAKSYTCEAGEFLKTWQDAITGEWNVGCVPCDAGYTCDGGTWTADEIDPITKTVGGVRIECPESEEFAELTESTSNQTGGLPLGFAQSYTTSTDKCIMPRLYADDFTVFARQDTYNADLAAAGARVAFCTYDSETHTYTKDCTPAYKVCDDMSMLDVMAFMYSEDAVGMWQMLSNQTELTDELFTESATEDPLNDPDDEFPVALDMCISVVPGVCEAGTYLIPENYGKLNQCAPCEAGYYCVGDNWDGESEFVSGKTGCAVGTYSTTKNATDDTVCLPCPTDYTTDSTGTDSPALCYTACSGAASCGDMPHSATCAYQENGRMYNDGFNMCDTNISACAAHYTTTNLVAWINGHTQIDSDTGDITSTPLPTDWTTLQICHLDGTGSLCSTEPHGTVKLPLTNAPVDYVKLSMVCNNVPSDAVNPTHFNTSMTGKYCWRRISAIQDMSIDSDWVYMGEFANAAACAESCGDGLDMSSAIESMNTISTRNVCVGNNINLTWGTGNTDPDIPGVCTYGGQFTAPAAPAKDNYMFLGWTYGSVTAPGS